MIEPADLQDVVSKWWFSYDEGRFEVMTSLLTEDVHFTCRTDTPDVAWAEFATSDDRGRDTVMRWQTEHRRNSPYPLRHHGTNVHIVERSGDEATFASYLLVNQVADEMPSPIPGGVVTGTVRRESDGVLRIAAMHVVLDTLTSDVFATVRG
jgi:SnoaL-like domain